MPRRTKIEAKIILDKIYWRSTIRKVTGHLDPCKNTGITHHHGYCSIVNGTCIDIHSDAEGDETKVAHYSYLQNVDT